MIITKEGQEEIIILFTLDYNEITFLILQSTSIFQHFNSECSHSLHSSCFCSNPDTYKKQTGFYNVLSWNLDFLCFMILGGLKFHLFFVEMRGANLGRQANRVDFNPGIWLICLANLLSIGLNNLVDSTTSQVPLQIKRWKVRGKSFLCFTPRLAWAGVLLNTSMRRG